MKNSGYFLPRRYMERLRYGGVRDNDYAHCHCPANPMVNLPLSNATSGIKLCDFTNHKPELEIPLLIITYGFPWNASNIFYIIRLFFNLLKIFISKWWRNLWMNLQSFDSIIIVFSVMQTFHLFHFVYCLKITPIGMNWIVWRQKSMKWPQSFQNDWKIMCGKMIKS